MNGDTLADLMREIGVTPARAAFENQRPRRPMPRTMQNRPSTYEDLQRRPREAPGAYQTPRNQFAEAGQFALEQTGLPSVRRSAAAFADNRPGEGFAEGAMGVLGVLGMAAGARSAAPVRPAPRLPMRPPVAEAPPVRPTPAAPRLPDAGSVRQSTGARVPDGGNAAPLPARGNVDGGALANLRAQGFDVDAPLYRGHDGDPSTGHWRASEGMNGEGVYTTRDPVSAERWAVRQAENNPTVHTIYARGRIADSRDGLTFEDAREQGFSGLHYYDRNGEYVETIVFDPANVSPSQGRRSPQLPNAGPARPPPRPRPPPRTR